MKKIKRVEILEFDGARIKYGTGPDSGFPWEKYGYSFIPCLPRKVFGGKIVKIFKDITFAFMLVALFFGGVTIIDILLDAKLLPHIIFIEIIGACSLISATFAIKAKKMHYHDNLQKFEGFSRIISKNDIPTVSDNEVKDERIICIPKSAPVLPLGIHVFFLRKLTFEEMRKIKNNISIFDPPYQILRHFVIKKPGFVNHFHGKFVFSNDTKDIEATLQENKPISGPFARVDWDLTRHIDLKENEDGIAVRASLFDDKLIQMHAERGKIKTIFVYTYGKYLICEDYNDRNIVNTIFPWPWERKVIEA